MSSEVSPAEAAPPTGSPTISDASDDQDWQVVSVAKKKKEKDGSEPPVAKNEKPSHPNTNGNKQRQGTTASNAPIPLTRSGSTSSRVSAIITPDIREALQEAATSVTKDLEHHAGDTGVRQLPVTTIAEGQKDVKLSDQMMKILAKRRDQRGGSAAISGRASGTSSKTSVSRKKLHAYGHSNKFGATPAPSDRSWRRDAGASPQGSLKGDSKQAQQKKQNQNNKQGDKKVKKPKDSKNKTKNSNTSGSNETNKDLDDITPSETETNPQQDVPDTLSFHEDMIVGEGILQIPAKVIFQSPLSDDGSISGGSYNGSGDRTPTLPLPQRGNRPYGAPSRSITAPAPSLNNTGSTVRGSALKRGFAVLDESDDEAEDFVEEVPTSANAAAAAAAAALLAEGTFASLNQKMVRTTTLVEPQTESKKEQVKKEVKETNDAEKKDNKPQQVKRTNTNNTKTSSNTKSSKQTGSKITTGTVGDTSLLGQLSVQLGIPAQQLQAALGVLLILIILRILRLL